MKNLGLLLGAFIVLFALERAGHRYPSAFHFKARHFTNSPDTKLGFVCNPETTAKPGAPIDIFAAGDAYTNGTPSLAADEMFPGLLAKALKKNVLNLGCGEYGTLQEEIVAGEWLDRAKPKQLILEIYPGNDWLDNYDYSDWSRNHAGMPYELYRRIASDGISTKGLFYRVHARLIGRSVVYTGLYDLWRSRHPADDSRRADAPAAQIGEEQAYAAVSRLKTLCAQKNVKLLVLIVRIRSALDENHPRYAPVREFLKKNRIDFVDPFAEISTAQAKGQDMFLPSGHWNAAAQKLVADLIARKLKKS